MCAVIGAVIENPKIAHFDMIRRVFHESRIRGMHATGLSYLKGGEIHTFKEPVPADEFRKLDDLEEMVNDDGILYLIGHCRYSTSDLLYNQPIANATTSIVHNGVITQHDPADWEVLHGYSCEGKNDTELLLHSLADYSPLEHWKDASLAVCELHVDGRVRAYRNGKRPLYLTIFDAGRIITSTANVANRANLNYATVPLSMNVYHTFDSELTLELEKVDIEGAVDYQL
jgi:glutamine phosphoribosylpyrophosphate amidotransferase